MERPIAILLFSALLSGHAWSDDPAPTLKVITEKGGSGYFNCSYQGKKASKPCRVNVSRELVNHPDVIEYSGQADIDWVLTIKWPDGDLSKYAWADSGEMWNLTAKEAGGYRLSGDETEQDWSRGFVIKKGGGAEHVRLW